MLVLLNFQGNEQPVDLELLASNSGRIMDADVGLTHPTVPEDRSSLSRAGREPSGSAQQPAVSANDEAFTACCEGFVHDADGLN